MRFLLLLLASLSFAVGGLFMKYSNGFTKPAACLAVLVLFCSGAALQARAMKESDLAVAYIFVLGIEAVFAGTLSVLVLHERLSLTRVIAVCIVVAGVCLLQKS